ncbi:hypothetical protein LCGC14_2537340 [marine sediment metagenome]|uniref:Uncharacterized protein n=1 Tax=marine sediment metagenome TaxID=412755 RepID=A0A0F9AS90_9ZZZZ
MKTIIDIPIGPKALYRFRQSAIEDIKKLIKDYDKLPAVNKSDEDKYNAGSIRGKAKYIKEKFNITDEDLR